jgi:hypothetical protein
VTQPQLFNEPMSGPAAITASGYRETPAEPIDLLCSLPEFRALSGPIVDLGVGGGALCRGIEERLPTGPGAASAWALIDSRPQAIRDILRWVPPKDVLARRIDATERWERSIDHWLTLDEKERPRVVSNPPWSVLRCPRCARQWRARAKRMPGEPQPTTGVRCPDCKVPGADLAIAMIAQTARELPDADIWVLHLSTWVFHPERAKFWCPAPTPDAPGQWAPDTHRWAGEYKIAGIRVAYGDPAGGKVAPHNVMSAWYHWVPVARYTGFVSRVHRWPLPTEYPCDSA